MSRRFAGAVGIGQCPGPLVPGCREPCQTDAPIVPCRLRRARGEPGARRRRSRNRRRQPARAAVRRRRRDRRRRRRRHRRGAADRWPPAGTCVVLEASGAVGGRCITDTAIFGVPYDRGARWLHTPEINPVARLAPQTGLDIYPAPPGQRVRIGRRYARESEMEDMLAALVRANTAIADAARKADVACAQALPKDLGEWRSTIEFMLGPYFCGKDCRRDSRPSISRAPPSATSQAFCRQGLGAVLAKLAAGLPVRLSTPVTRINWGGRAGVEVETAQGTIDARAVDRHRVDQCARRRQDQVRARPAEAPARRRSSGSSSAATITSTLELPGNPLGLRTRRAGVREIASPRTAALLANMSGSTLCTVDVGGALRARALRQGRQGDDRLRARLARRSLRHRPQARRRAHAMRRAGTRSRGCWARCRRRRRADSLRAGR